MRVRDPSRLLCLLVAVVATATVAVSVSYASIINMISNAILHYIVDCLITSYMVFVRSLP